MPKDDARVWLREHGYAEVADQIDALIERWKRAGKKTRRNWWEVLAGGVNGKPRTVDGVAFPVLRAAQVRQGVKAGKGSGRKAEVAPPVRVSNRWPNGGGEED
jgi:hypothetical protein